MTNFSPSQTQSSVLTTLRSFLLAILPSGVGVYQAQVNRVAEPAESDFVMMTLIDQKRVATNLNTYQDCSFTASMSGTVLTVTHVNFGTIALNTTLFGTSVPANAQIVSQTGGTTGGVGTYTISASATISSEKMACGQIVLMQSMNMSVQLDVHGPNSAANAMLISTFYRDQTAQDFWSGFGPGDVSPIAADDPKQIPFWNDQQQMETRWVVTAETGVNVSMSAPQDFADALSVTIENPANSNPV